MKPASANCRRVTDGKCVKLKANSQRWFFSFAKGRAPVECLQSILFRGDNVIDLGGVRR